MTCYYILLCEIDALIIFQGSLFADFDHLRGHLRPDYPDSSSSGVSILTVAPILTVLFSLVIVSDYVNNTFHIFVFMVFSSVHIQYE